MELVAAAKMRRATTAVVKTRPYAQIAWETVRAIMRRASNVTHPLMQSREGATRTLIVVFASDRGLAGGYNVNIVRKVSTMIAEQGADNVDIVAIGRRAEAVGRTKAKVIASFPGLSNQPTLKDILPVVRMIMELFMEGKYANVYLGYTDFISGISQVPKISQLLPLVPLQEKAREGEEEVEYLFEPSPEALLNRILPGIVETKIFHALLEAVASEHAARMMAMRNATDSATEMLDSLTFTYNQARQAAITQEIAELVGGAAALQK